MPEGLPNTVLEALTVSRLMVATRNSGVLEVIQDGVDGFLVDCDDMAALATTVNRALNLEGNLRITMVEQAKISVKDITIENQLSQLRQVYIQLLEERG